MSNHSGNECPRPDPRLPRARRGHRAGEPAEALRWLHEGAGCGRDWQIPLATSSCVSLTVVYRGNDLPRRDEHVAATLCSNPPRLDRCTTTLRR
jgi:hypothetical protein